MKHLLTLLLVFTCSCTEDILTPVCPDTCYSGLQSDLGKGACSSGTPSCDKNGDIVSCDGEVLSSPEVCDGIDNDCDGIRDEGLSYSQWHYNNDCPQVGACADTDLTCVAGDWYCMVPEGGNEPEVCDLIDNDCNGFVDDITVDQEFCYTGPPGTALVGACTPGLPTCSPTGGLACSDVVPRAEVCDGIDNDCDGFVDNVDRTYGAADIVFGLDLSGSMTDIHDLVEAVVCAYASTASEETDASYHFALVGIAHPNDSWYLAQNLATADELCRTMRDLPSGGDSEPTISAAMTVADPLNPLEINWRRNSKRVYIGFADEDAASPYSTCTGDQDACTERDVDQTLEFCAESETSIHWFTRDLNFYVEQAYGCGGETFWLNPNYSYLLESLNSLLEEICIDDGPPLSISP